MRRKLADGGFAEIPAGAYRPDATAWAILGLKALHAAPDEISTARARLQASQQPNGSITLSPDHPETVWPTAVTILALYDAPQFSSVCNKAVNFLLATAGEQIPISPDAPVGHDSTIPGWPWISGTHAWVEPTAMAIQALVCMKKSSHERVLAGIRLLLDRQLPGGGWNYGGTTVFGKTLDATPAPTGMALWALAGLVPREQVTASLDLLGRRLPELRTPLSLGWALHGLAAWDTGLKGYASQVADCLGRQTRHGSYATSQLGVLLAATTLFNQHGGECA